MWIIILMTLQNKYNVTDLYRCTENSLILCSLFLTGCWFVSCKINDSLHRRQKIRL